jgi:hypothetical protein
MPTASPKLLRQWSLYQLARLLRRMPRTARHVAYFVIGLWFAVRDVWRMLTDYPQSVVRR